MQGIAFFSNRPKNNGWTRDLAAKIHAKAGVRVAVDDMACAGYVYGVFIEACGECFYKSGMAKQPDARAAAHQNSLPFEATIVIAYFVANIRQEGLHLHTMCRQKLSKRGLKAPLTSAIA